MIRVWNALADFATRIAKGFRHDPDDDNWFFDYVSLSRDEWRAVEFLGRSSRGVEPLSNSAGLTFLIGNRLLEMRLAERGRIDVSDEAYPMGYRLTARGLAVLKRGWRAPFDSDG